MSMFASTFRWLQRKRYQYEVTFSLYMLTPTEKFIFNSFIFLFFSMILIAAILYLPQHISFISNRAWFYYHGEDPKSTTLIMTMTSATDSTVMETAKATISILEKEAMKAAGLLQGSGHNTVTAEL